MTTTSSSSDTMKIVEYDGDPSQSEDRPHREYKIDPAGHILTMEQAFIVAAAAANNRSHSLFDWLRHYAIGAPKQVLTDLFLPLEYPHSVRKEYMSYQICDSLQGLCSYLRGVVSTSAVLQAAGVGNAEATAMSAAMTWALRDGLGMVGGLTFSYCTSFLFDAHVKEFRLFADIINDVGLTLDMLAPYAGERLLYISSAATICKIMCGISAGATKGSITQHFCLHGNMADLNAKEGTQETLVSLIGMILGVLLAKYLHELEEQPDGKARASSISWTIFNLLTILHVWVNYEGVKLLRLRTLNRQRAKEALQKMVESAQGSSSSLKEALQSIQSPDDISESLVASTSNMFLSRDMILGVRLNKLLGNGSTLSADTILEQAENRNYLIAIMGKRQVGVSLFRSATSEDELMAFLHAYMVHKLLTRLDDATLNRDEVLAAAAKDLDRLKAAGFSLQVMEKNGWDVKSRLYLGFGRYRIELSKSKSD